MARYSEAHNRASQKYNKKAYDVITVRVPKGARAKYKALAESKGSSLNSLILTYLESLPEPWKNGHGFENGACKGRFAKPEDY